MATIAGGLPSPCTQKGRQWHGVAQCFFLFPFRSHWSQRATASWSFRFGWRFGPRSNASGGNILLQWPCVGACSGSLHTCKHLLSPCAESIYWYLYPHIPRKVCVGMSGTHRRATYSGPCQSLLQTSSPSTPCKATAAAAAAAHAAAAAAAAADDVTGASVAAAAVVAVVSVASGARIVLVVVP